MASSALGNPADGAGPSSDEEMPDPFVPYFDEIRSTSNTSVAFGGMTPPAPRAP